MDMFTGLVLRCESVKFLASLFGLERWPICQTSQFRLRFALFYGKFSYQLRRSWYKKGKHRNDTILLVNIFFKVKTGSQSRHKG